MFTENRAAWGCSHEMAYEYYLASLDFYKNDTFFLARPCESWKTFNKGNCSCGARAQYMGYNVNLR